MRFEGIDVSLKTLSADAHVTREPSGLRESRTNASLSCQKARMESYGSVLFVAGDVSVCVCVYFISQYVLLCLCLLMCVRVFRV